MEVRPKENLSAAPQLTKKRTPEYLRHQSVLQFTDNQTTTILTLREKEQQMKAATQGQRLCITGGLARSTATEGSVGQLSHKTLRGVAFSLARGAA